MGLTIEAYRGLSKNRPARFNVCIYVNELFPATRATPFKNGVIYYTENEPIRKRIGSYSYYNWWRDKLSLRFFETSARDVWTKPGKFRGRPFVELIDFSDCEGTIGTVVAKKLAKDFTKYRSRLNKKQFTDEDDEMDFWYTYNQFSEAFEIASHGGAVCFF